MDLVCSQITFYNIKPSLYYHECSVALLRGLPWKSFISNLETDCTY